jgi:lipoprotein NlpI
MRILASALGVLLLAVPALPQSTADLVKRGHEYVNKGDYAAAIEAYTQALGLEPKSAAIFYARGYAHYRAYDDDAAIQDFSASIQLQPKAEAFRARARAYENKADYEHATQDYTQAIRLTPADTTLLYDRAYAYERKGDYGVAIADFNQILQRFPEAQDAYRGRGLALLNSARFSEALEDLSRAVQIKPGEHYNVIWLYIARTRNAFGAEKELALNAAKLDLTKWPGPVIQLFLGKTAPEAVLQAASDKDEQKAREQLCEANFFTAEHQAFHYQNDAARSNFLLALKNCDKNYFLYTPAARAALASLR